MVLGLPVINKPELTQQAIDFLAEAVVDKEKFTLVIIDNDSKPAYRLDKLRLGELKVKLIRNKENMGYYYPLLQLYKKFPEEDYLGLFHNDLFIYEKGFDNRLRASFEQDPQLGMIGFVGSWMIDYLGGRGAGTMCFYRGERGQSQAAGERIRDLQPSLTLDSVFMMTRRELVPSLKIDEHIAICHFYDRIWPMRIIEAGYRVGTLGVEVDHMGGETAIGVAKYTEDAKKWCDKEGIDYPPNDPGLGVYLEAERRYLSEYREEKRMLPARIYPDWRIEPI